MLEQATIQGFEAKGFSIEKSESLLRKSVEIACEARTTFYDKCKSSSDIADDDKKKMRPILVAASVGSYGAYLADGSEYRCFTLFTRLYQLHSLDFIWSLQKKRYLLALSVESMVI